MASRSKPNATLMDINAVSERLGVPVRWVRRRVAERTIPHFKLGHLLRFDPSDIEEWLEATRVQETDLGTSGRLRRHR